MGSRVGGRRRAHARPKKRGKPKLRRNEKSALWNQTLKFTKKKKKRGKERGEIRRAQAALNLTRKGSPRCICPVGGEQQTGHCPRNILKNHGKEEKQLACPYERFRHRFVKCEGGPGTLENARRGIPEKKNAAYQKAIAIGLCWQGKTVTSPVPSGGGNPWYAMEQGKKKETAGKLRHNLPIVGNHLTTPSRKLKKDLGGKRGGRRKGTVTGGALSPP